MAVSGCITNGVGSFYGTLTVFDHAGAVAQVIPLEGGAKPLEAATAARWRAREDPEFAVTVHPVLNQFLFETDRPPIRLPWDQASPSEDLPAGGR